MIQAISVLKIMGFVGAVVLFLKASLIVRDARKPYGRTDPRGLQPEYHGAEFRSEMRRFYRHLGGAVTLVVLLLLLTWAFPT